MVIAIFVLIYLAGLIPAYLSLRHVFIRLCGIEGRTIGDAVWTVLCSLCSWITVIVVFVMMAILEVGDIDGKQAKFS